MTYAIFTFIYCAVAAIIFLQLTRTRIAWWRKLVLPLLWPLGIIILLTLTAASYIFPEDKKQYVGFMAMAIVIFLSGRRTEGWK